MPITRRHLLQATALILVMGPPRLVYAAQFLGTQPAISFLVIGDWGKIQNQKNAKRVANAMAVATRAEQTQFIVSLGDNFYPAGVTSVDDPLWEEAFESVYSQSELDIPWYVILGNHDYRGNVQAQIDYGKKSRRWNMPQNYYVVRREVDGTTADLFFMDTNGMDKIHWWNDLLWADSAAERQLAWLDEELSASTANWKIVVGHHPVFSGGKHKGSPFLAKTLPQLLEKHGVRLYINGHDHDLQHVKKGKVSYLTSGAAAESRATTAIDGTEFSVSSLGFLSVRLQAKVATISFIGANSETLYQTTIGLTA